MAKQAERLDLQESIELEIAVLTGKTQEMELAGTSVTVSDTYNKDTGLLSIVSVDKGRVPPAVIAELANIGYTIQYSSKKGLTALEVYVPIRRRNEAAHP